MIIRTTALGACLALSLSGAALAHDIAHHDTTVNFTESRFTPPDAVLIDQFGKETHFLADVADGHRMIISFFYANCVTVCPVTNAIMATVAQDAFDLSGEPVRLVSITVDPERDGPQVINELAETMGPNKDWIWLTGASPEIRRLTHSLGMRYERPEDHSVLFIVGDTGSGLFASTTGIPTAEQLLTQLQKLEQQ